MMLKVVSPVFSNVTSSNFAITFGVSVSKTAAESGLLQPIDLAIELTQDVELRIDRDHLLRQRFVLCHSGGMPCATSRCRMGHSSA